MRAYLGIGSNLGDRWANLRAALVALGTLDNGVALSPIYETAPVGGPPGQGPYLNCVARIETAMSPIELLEFAQRIEHDRGRVRTTRFGPRTLDVDILYIDGFTSDTPDLVVPHPRMFERAFVLAPLEDLEPSLVPAGWRSEPALDDAVRMVGCLLPPFVERELRPSASNVASSRSDR